VAWGEWVRIAETSDNAEPGIVGSRRGKGSDKSSERDASLDGGGSEIDTWSIGNEDGEVGLLIGGIPEDGGEAGVGDGTDVVELVNVFFA
jgi:hypothetical protein